MSKAKDASQVDYFISFVILLPFILKWDKKFMKKRAMKKKPKLKRLLQPMAAQEFAPVPEYKIIMQTIMSPRQMMKITMNESI